MVQRDIGKKVLVPEAGVVFDHVARHSARDSSGTTRQDAGGFGWLVLTPSAGNRTCTERPEPRPPHTPPVAATLRGELDRLAKRQKE